MVSCVCVDVSQTDVTPRHSSVFSALCTHLCHRSAPGNRVVCVCCGWTAGVPGGLAASCGLITPFSERVVRASWVMSSLMDICLRSSRLVWNKTPESITFIQQMSRRANLMEGGWRLPIDDGLISSWLWLCPQLLKPKNGIIDALPHNCAGQCSTNPNGDLFTFWF